MSSGFLLRAIAGGVAASIPLSQWFLLIMAFGSLFMAAGKRYAELQLAYRHRREDPQVAAVLHQHLPAVRVVAGGVRGGRVLRAVGVRAGRTARHVSVRDLDAPFTIAILRYAVDIDGGQAGEPEEIALSDRVLQLLAIAWIGMVGVAVYLA